MMFSDPTLSGSFRTQPLSPAHLSGCAALERLCFPDEPWSETALGLLCRPGALGVVLTDPSDTPLAYAGMTYAADEGSVTNVAVHPAHRRQGFGRAVVEGLLDAARQHGLCSVYLEVRPSNAPALSLYRALGFCETGRRKNFYRHPTEDALLMCAELGDTKRAPRKA